MPALHTTSARAFCWAFSCAVAIVGCKQTGKPITSIDLVDRSGRIDKKKLEERALKAAERFKGFDVRSAKPGEEAYQLSVRVQLAGERPAVGDDGGGPIAGQMHRGVAVEMSLAQLKGLGRFEGDAMIEKNVPAESSPEELAYEALDEAARSLNGGIALATASDAEVIAAIGDKDSGVRKRAVVMAGERKIKDAVPKLSELVRDETLDDHELVLKAIGALVAIGDDRAVPALIDAGARRSSAYLSQILFAVAQLGGRQAEGYLLTVSNGHADPEIRKNAGAALEELEAKHSKEDDR